jgi:imidazolonepropionase-like amidohydrolase
MRLRWTVLASVCLAGLMWDTAQPAPMVLKNITLLDGTGAAPVHPAALVIDGGRVSWAGPLDRLPAPAGAQSIDLSGKYVIPGLIDAHVHLALVHGLTQDVHFYTKELVQQQLGVYAAYGITSVLVLGTDPDLIFQIRAEQRRGPATSTRVFTAGQGLVYKGSYGGVAGLNGRVATAADARAAVDAQAAKGVDVIKFWVDDEFGSLPLRMPPEVTQAVIDEAHHHHLHAIAHVFYLEDARTLVKQGVDALAHSVRDKPVDASFIDAMKQHQTWQLAETLSREASFTYSTLPFLKDPFFTRAIAPSTLETLSSSKYAQDRAAAANFSRYPAVLQTALQNTQREAAAGVMLGMGTDSGPSGRFPGYFAHWELELMVKAGLTPLQALTAATGNNARFLGARDFGTLQPGKWADLVVLDSDPIADIRNTRSIHSVYIAGQSVPTIWTLCVDRPPSACPPGSR